MHRSIETVNIPPPVPPPLHSSSFATLSLDSQMKIASDPDKNKHAIYSVPKAASSLGSKLRSDYYNSQGTHCVLGEDDPGILSEADTTSTGFRRGGRARSSLPIISKTLEKPLGLVFLQFRDETKRAVLPNEITTIDTVKALFVRAFPKGLSMQSFDALQRKIYVLDQRKDMFYELDNLRDIRDRSVLKIYESDPLSASLSRQPQLYSEETNYFSEPEFDSNSETSHRHTGFPTSANKYNRSLTINTMSSKGFIPPVPPKPQRSSYGYAPIYDEPMYANTGDKRPPSRSGTCTPIIDEEARYRVDAMERHLANLTGLVQQALAGKPGGPISSRNSDYANINVVPSRQPAQRDLNTTNVTPSVCGPVKSAHHTSNESKPAEKGENGPIFLRYPDPMLMEYLDSVQNRVKDMRAEARALKRHTSAQALTMREIVKESFERLKHQFSSTGAGRVPAAQSDRSKRPSAEIEVFQREADRVSREMHRLETTAMDLQTGVINRQSTISLRQIECETTALNELSNQLSDLRLKLPLLQETMKVNATSAMEKLIKDEMFIKEEPGKLDELAKRCKKLAGTLLHLDQMAAVQHNHMPFEREVSVDMPPAASVQSGNMASPTGRTPDPPARRESLATSETSSHGRKKVDKKAQDMLDDLLSELDVFTDASSREGSPAKESSTIKRSPKNGVKTTMTQSTSDGYTQLTATGLTPPSITPSNSSQSTATTLSTLSSATDNSSMFSAGSDSTTLSKVQVGVGETKAIVTSHPSSRKPSDAEKSLTDWLCNISTPPPPPRSTSKSPMSSPGSKAGSFYTLPGYSRTVSEPGDYQDTRYSDYANIRELKSPNIKDQRLTPQQQNKIGNYYVSKLRKGSDPGTYDSPYDNNVGDYKKDGEDLRMQSREPPILPPKPGQEDSNLAPPLPPRNRQQVLEERHQELLRKQRQLQEQYARLQQLQRDQKTRASSPSSRAMTSPSSGSMDDLKRRHLSRQSNNNDHYATLPSNPSYHQMTITNGESPPQKIYETDIL